MDDLEAGRYWNRNAEAWTRLARQGLDVYRDLLNTPAFLKPALLGGALDCEGGVCSPCPPG